MKPYYQDDFITLYHADCLQHLDILDQADVMVTDPPYGMAFQSNQSKYRRLDRIKGDESTTARDTALEAWGDRPALVFGTWTQPRPTGTKMRLIWDKVNCGMGNLTIPWGPTDEEIYVTGEWPPISPGGRKREGGTPRRFSNVITIATLNSQARDRPDHPTPKPIPLMEHLIERCPPGVVADPFVGSGATLRAAKNLGRKAIGFEIEEKYCEIAANQLAQEVLFA